MIEKKINSLSIWFFENILRCEGISHFVSTRIGGYSNAPFDSLNLSFNVGDDEKRVLKNRKLLAGSIGISLGSLTTAKQVHDNHVKIVSKETRGMGGIDYKGAIDATDAMVTDVPDICLMVLLADCVPILFYDRSKRVIGAVHAGVKGTLRLIAANTVKVFRDHYGCLSDDILVGIGPSIGSCCYEVGREVMSEAREVFGTKQGCVRSVGENGKGFIDLWTANLKQLLQAGIPEKNIETANMCTYHHANQFYSYRHEKKTGRFGAGIIIR